MKTFQPWAIDGDTLQLARWPYRQASAVLVEVDVFEPFEGPARRTGPGSGERIWVCTACRCGFADTRGPCTYCARMMVPAGSADCLQNLFRHIDLHQKTHYVLRTRHPERVRECWPCKRDTDGDGNCPACSRDQSSGCRNRGNVILQIGPIHTQEDADRLLPAGLECSGLVGSVEVYCQPTERIQFPLPCRESVFWAAVAGITVSGGDQPMHPDWVRCLRDQAVAAGIEFVFESWGDYGPVCSKRTGSVVVYGDGRWCDFTREAIIAEERRSGKDHDRCSPHTMFRVGREHSGNTLDGRTWPGTEAG